MRNSLALVGLLLATAPLLGDTAQAFASLQHGRVAEAERTLRTTLAASPQDAYARQLLCRVFYAQDQADLAVPECEAAVAAAPDDTQNQLWLGRAYGKKAQHANPLAAFALARKVHVAFEHAIQVSPTNAAAMSDLGEFYVAAPAVVGGGIDKARSLADTMQTRFPAGAHRIRAYIAVKQKDNRTAEAEFQAEVAAAKTPGAYLDLALFYQQREQLVQAEATVRMGIDIDSARGASLLDAASILISMERAPDLAEQCLRTYLASPAQTDAAPVFKARLQLGRLLAQRGDRAGALREYAASLALAPGFLPARQAAQQVSKGA